MRETFVIVGANLAGGTAAAALREEGSDATIVLLGEEPHAPYERPPMSKEFLRGEFSFDKTLVKPETFWRDNDIDTRFGVRATGIDVRARTVALSDGSSVGFDRLLLTTGGRNRRPPIPGIDLEGVYQLRTREEAERIRDAAQPGARAVVVGMGFIGAEVAASLRARGVEVTVVEPNPLPLGRVFGPEIGGAFRDLHAEHGVTMLFEDVVESFEGTTSIERVRTKNGKTLDCDLCVVGIGIQPNDELAKEAGIDAENGILVDELCRTSVEGVFAAGDVANHLHPLVGRRIRVEHWQNAIKQAQAAARSMLGKSEPYAEVHWFWSDQYDDNIQYAGHHGPDDTLVLRGNVAERDFIGFYVNGSRLTAAVAMNRGRDLRIARKMIEAKVVPNEAILGDDGVDLKSLLPV